MLLTASKSNVMIIINIMRKIQKNYESQYFALKTINR